MKTKTSRLLRATSLTVTFCLVLAAPALSQDDPMADGLSPRQRLDVLIRNVKEAQSALTTMTADFVQNKESSLLLEPESSKGRFSYSAPDKARWEYLEPSPVEMTILGEEMTTWYKELDRADRVSIGTVSEQVFKYMGASGSLETLMKYFSVTAEFPEAAGDPYHLSLLPKYPRIKKRLESMDLWIDPGNYMPSRLSYVEAGGDTTELIFSDLETNLELPSNAFDLDLPDGIEIKNVALRGRN
ncbi:MAG: outer membrane lipoprotein carrier protein LolA [Acidobacteriota bacterium]